jgi:hypothetical protein
MRRKILIVLALVFSAGNLAVGVTYAAICKSTSGARACGTTCASTSGGNCGCEGTCTKEEMDWVASGKSGDDDELEETVLN